MSSATTPAAGPLCVIVPACDEETVIDRCLRSLTGSGTKDDVCVLVVCNGCVDATAAVVQAYSARYVRVRLLELPERSKVSAIRAGLASTTGSVAVVDADVTLSPDAIDGLRQTLAQARPVIAAPRLQVDLSGCGRTVRGFYRIWLQQPYVTSGLIGAGVYATNQAGRSRLTAMPDVMADDAWARACFDPGERVISAGVFTIYPARSTWALVRRRARIVTGNQQVRRLRDAPEVARSPALTLIPAPTISPALTLSPALRRVLDRVGRHGLRDLVSFQLVERLARGLARWRAARGTSGTWAQDMTSRRTPAAR